MSVNATDEWAAEACTLPTVEQPLRRAELDDLFAHDVVGVRPTSPRELTLELRPAPEVAARAADLAVRETGCCSFFTFALTMTEGRVELAISTASAHGAVLTALQARAEERVGAGT